MGTLRETRTRRDTSHNMLSVAIGVQAVMPIKCPVSGSWNCEGCGELPCYQRVYQALLDWGLPREIAWELAQEWKYSAEDDSDDSDDSK